jgi:hypothetical protein
MWKTIPLFKGSVGEEKSMWKTIPLFRGSVGEEKSRPIIATMKSIHRMKSLLVF